MNQSEPLAKIARENFKAGRHLSMARVARPSRWTYGGLPQSVVTSHNLVDRILARRASAEISKAGASNVCRTILARLKGK